MKKNRAKQLEKLKHLGTWAARDLSITGGVPQLWLSNNTCWHRQKTVGCFVWFCIAKQIRIQKPQNANSLPSKRKKNTSPETVFSVRFTTPLGPIRTQQTHELCATNRGMGLIPISYGNLTHWYYNVLYIPSSKCT